MVMAAAANPGRPRCPGGPAGPGGPRWKGQSAVLNVRIDVATRGVRKIFSRGFSTLFVITAAI